MRGLRPLAIRGGPRVHLPQPDYLLFTGEVGDALAPVAEKGQTLNLWWLQDRSWCVATEIDGDVTYVAGSTELVAALHGEPPRNSACAGR